MSVKNKVVVITGAGGVLCSVFAKALAREGAKVALIGLHEANVKRVCEEIVADGGMAMYYECNVLDKSALEIVHADVNERFGKCDILINGAGGNNPRATTANEYYMEGDEAREDIKTFFNLDKEDFDFVFSLNLMGTVLPTQVFAKDMTRDGGVILNVSSMNAIKPLTKIPAYSSAKSAVTNLTEWLAVHFAGAGIRVNAIAPGFFVTKQNKDLLFDSDGNPTARSNKILNATPMRRFGKPEELVGTLLWLCDDDASGFVTGITVAVDGGFSAYSGV